ncbi:hypothetical protein [Actinophytocola sp.]|uniref:hypothetical protein n=1 Tax=Actinophytocola sp. TaxID=1872138 RepID=UPI003D6B599D
MREFVRREGAEPYNVRDGHGHPVRTLGNRRECQAESDRLAGWFLGLHPTTQRKLTVFVVRCPVKGCLLGRVFRRGDPLAAVRYVWLGVAWARGGTAGILNWAWDGGRGSKEFMVTGCAHGGGNVEFGLLHGMVEALDSPQSTAPQEWLHRYDEPVQRGYARRTLMLPDTHWQTWT